MPAVDTGGDDTMDHPARNAAEVSPSDSASLGYVTRAIYVGTTGAVKVTMKGGGDVTFTAVPAGSILPIRATHVLNTGTTASNIVALW